MIFLARSLADVNYQISNYSKLNLSIFYVQIR